MSPRQHIGEKAAIVSSVREARKMILLRKTIQTGSCERTDLNKRFFRHDMLSWSVLADEGRSASLPITLCGVTMREVLITLAAKRNHTGGSKFKPPRNPWKTCMFRWNPSILHPILFNIEWGATTLDRLAVSRSR